MKLYVRDAVLSGIQKDLESVSDMQTARKYLQENLPKIKEIAQNALQSMGFAEQVQVSLKRERFDARVYETFSLPAGVYDALRIVIGEGNGKNWWCVVFPALCVPAASEDFRNVAAGAGFTDVLSKSLTGEGAYKFRFYCLDALGHLENILFAG